jgi:hypothetical protein
MIRRDVGSFLLKLFGMGATPTSGLVSVVRDVPVFPSSLVCPRPFVCFGCFVSRVTETLVVFRSIDRVISRNEKAETKQ